MTGRTHDLAAFTTVSYIASQTDITGYSLATVIACICSTFIGGLAPDMDQPTADLWNRIPAGSVIGRMITPLLGGHRMLSHSIIGIGVIGIFSRWLLFRMGSVILVDMHAVWIAFVAGFISHLVADLFTHEGVPLLFPLPFKIGIPPFAFLRFHTGGFIEKSLIFPGLLFLTGYIYYANYHHFLQLVKTLH